MNIEILGRIIQDGSLIRTQVGMNGWENGIIISHIEDIIQVNLALVYYKMAVMAGDLIRCKYYYNGKEYMFEGEIERVTIYDVPSIYIKITNIKIFRNKRDSYRVDIRLGADILPEGSEQHIYCIANNLSDNGVGLISRIELDIGSKITCDILIDYRRIFRVEGRIARQIKVNGCYEIGIKIDAADTKGRSDLKALINEYREANEILMEDTLLKTNQVSYIAEKEQNVMIADNCEASKLVVKKLLLLKGFTKILEAVDRTQVLSFAMKLKPEIIILDILLMDLNGSEAIDEIFKISPNSKIIVVSTIDNRKIIEDIKAKGVAAYLIKPFDNKQLLEIIDGILDSKIE